jgi:hypothetical protein
VTRELASPTRPASALSFRPVLAQLSRLRRARASQSADRAACFLLAWRPVSEEPGVGHENLVLQYGKTLRFTGFLGVRSVGYLPVELSQSPAC